MDTPAIEKELADLQHIYETISEFLVNYSFQLIGAIIVFLLGLWIANKVARALGNVLLHHKVDITLSNFVTNLVKILIIVMVAIIALGKLGISVTPFVAAIGAASLGAGLALQGMLANYAAGVTIIVTRPFIVTNTITLHGVSGIVKEINLGFTILTTADGEEITIPNKHIIGEILENTFEYSLVETHLGIAYQDQPRKAIKVLEQTLATHFSEGRVDVADNEESAEQQRPEAQIGLDNLGDSAIVIGVRYWVPSETYHQDKYHINLIMYEALIEAGFSIPFPQREVRLVGESPENT